jgi:hypothetical protein
MKHTTAQSAEKFPAGLFRQGDRVRLRRPAQHASSFDKPGAVLEVAAVLYFKFYTAPVYVLQAPGCAGVSSFKDGDLRPARRGALTTVSASGNC